MPPKNAIAKRARRDRINFKNVHFRIIEKFGFDYHVAVTVVAIEGIPLLAG